MQNINPLKRTGLFGVENKYKPSQLYQAAQEMFPQKYGTLDVHELSALSSGNGDIIIPPASDAELTGNEDMDRAILAPQGGLSIQKAIAKSKDFFDSDNSVKHIFIPIAQSRKVFFGLFGPKRSHFTYLKLSKSDGVIQATHYDSKGFWGRLYPLNGIKKALLTNFGKDKFSAVYTGQQGFFDDHNCGRYTLSGIQKSVENNGNPPDKITKSDLDGIDAKYKSYIQKHSSEKKASPTTEVIEQDGFALVGCAVQSEQNRESWRRGLENRRGMENGVVKER